MRSKVDLPHPDGPTSTTNSPSPMLTVTPWMTSSAPNAFVTSRIATEAMRFLRQSGLVFVPCHIVWAGPCLPICGFDFAPPSEAAPAQVAQLAKLPR
jgi:hypothetical protein